MVYEDFSRTFLFITTNGLLIHDPGMPTHITVDDVLSFLWRKTFKVTVTLSVKGIIIQFYKLWHKCRCNDNVMCNAQSNLQIEDY